MGLFGINGVRGIVNKGFTSGMAHRLGQAIGRYFNGVIAVATDTRVTSDMIKNAVMSGLMSVDCMVLDLGVIPVPALQYYVKTHKNVEGGVMITASHNSAEYNGIKCVFSDGTELSRAGEAKIEEYYNEGKFNVNPEKIGSVIEISGAGEIYLDAILENVNVDAVRKANLKIVADCANGASSNTTPLLLHKLGVNAVTLNANPQGEFPGRPNEPKEENLSDIIALIKAAGADLGVAHDLDGDRIIFIADDGRFISGDVGLAVIAKHILSKKKGAVVTAVNTSSLLEDTVVSNGGSIVYSEIGSLNVAKKMKDCDAIFGGEENGGMIFPDFQYCRDPSVAIVTMIECIIKNGPLSKQVKELPVYHMVKFDVDCPEEKKQALFEHIKENCEGGDIDLTDGIKVCFEDGWVLARASGSESKFRFYSESLDEGIAKVRAEEFEKDALEFLSI